MTVLERYRELGSTPEAAIQVRIEAEEQSDTHYHRMGERCWCGYLSVPSRFYEYKDGRQTNTQEDAERAYLEMSPSFVPASGMSPRNVPTYQPVPEDCACGKKRAPRRSECHACRKARQREGGLK